MRTQWENIQLKISGGGASALSDTLNKMGAEGWEAWHLESREDHALVFLKRPREAPTFGFSRELLDRINGGKS